jgi:ribose transport system permease protein
VGAAVFYWLAGALVAGIVNKPTAYEGDSYVLASVAAVVLGGTSLLGGRGNLVASALAALFLTQLQQYVLALGVTFAVQTLVQAAALTIGVALYTINWQRLRSRQRVRALPAPA